MRTLSLLLLAALAALAAPAASRADAQTPAAASPPLAVTRVNVVDVEGGRVLPDQTVLVAGNRIQAVGPSARTRIPAGARVVDGRGKYLIPGLWDMHVHAVWEETPAWMFPATPTDQLLRERMLGVSFRRLRSFLEAEEDVERAILDFANEPDVGHFGY